MSNPMIKVTDARYVYANGAVLALDGVSLEIPEGESVGIVGQNGSGKTTLTKLLNGLLKPTSGSIVVDGKDTANHTVQQMAATVGYVFQNPNHQLFATNVRAELAFGPTNLGLPPDEVERRVDEALAFFDIKQYGEMHPYRLSFPLRKLVGIASVTGVVKVVGFVASAPGFSGQPAVVNGASELLAEIFGASGAHARSAVGVAELPLDAPVEVELIVEVR